LSSQILVADWAMAVEHLCLLLDYKNMLYGLILCKPLGV
jgi:hypothetical protein